MNDDSLSPVFNLRGCEFETLSQSNLRTQTELYDQEGKINYISKDAFISDGNYLDNTMGVFKNPSMTDGTVIQNYNDETVKP
jgi:hypothetical protein